MAETHTGFGDCGCDVCCPEPGPSPATRNQVSAEKPENDGGDFKFVLSPEKAQQARSLLTGITTSAVKQTWGCGHSIHSVNGDALYAACPICYERKTESRIFEKWYSAASIGAKLAYWKRRTQKVAVRER